MNSEEITVKCENCRQDILANKMFLHEGFCKRNNVFCQHCERVYLKKDYEKNILEISKKSSKDNEESNSEEINQNNKYENKEENYLISKNNPPLQEKKIEYIEQYKINAPIYISEIAEASYDNNINEYFLPFFGINNLYSNNNNYMLGNANYMKQNEILDINKNILNYININSSNNGKNINAVYNPNNLNIPYNVNRNEDKLHKNILNNQNINIMNNKSKVEIKEKEEKKTMNKMNNKNTLVIKEINIIKNNNNNSGLTLGNQIVNIKKINSKKINLKNDNISLADRNRNSIDLKINDENIQKNKSNIIINNNIINYNSNNKLNEVNNLFNSIETNPRKESFIESKVEKLNKTPLKLVSNYKTKTEFNPIRIGKIRKKKMRNNIINDYNNRELSSKEPLDNVFKKKLKNNQNRSFLLPKNNINNENEKLDEEISKSNIPITIKIDLSHLNLKSYKEKINDSSNKEKEKEILIKQINPSFKEIKKSKFNNNKEEFRGKSEDRCYVRYNLRERPTNNYQYKTNTNSPKDKINIENKENINFRQKNIQKYEQKPKSRNINKIKEKFGGLKYKHSTEKVRNNIIDPFFFCDQNDCNNTNEKQNNINKTEKKVNNKKYSIENTNFAYYI